MIQGTGAAIAGGTEHRVIQWDRQVWDSGYRHSNGRWDCAHGYAMGQVCLGIGAAMAGGTEHRDILWDR